MKKLIAICMFLQTPVFSCDDCLCVKIKDLEKRIEILEKHKESNSSYLYFSTDTIKFSPGEINPTAYTCLKCGKTFAGKNLKTSCAVLHPPGDCCHYGEIEILEGKE